jgi:hypothetical protein
LEDLARLQRSVCGYLQIGNEIEVILLEPLNFYRLKDASTAEEDFRTLETEHLDVRLVETSEGFFIFVDSLDRKYAVRLIEPKPPATKMAVPEISPDPDNVLSNFSWSWLQNQPPDEKARMMKIHDRVNNE